MTNWLNFYKLCFKNLYSYIILYHFNIDKRKRSDIPTHILCFRIYKLMTVYEIKKIFKLSYTRITYTV